MKQFVFEGNQNLCYGCGACAQVCPVQSIEMQSNQEGFLYPVINKSTCIECEKCKRSCPAMQPNVHKVKNEKPKFVYAAKRKSLFLLMESTSGGVFSAFAEFILLNRGCVYGVTLERDFKVIHIRITDIKDLKRLKGSKYVQSDTSHTFEQVETDLKNGLSVLYSGTGCQIAGLKLFLNKEYEHLYTIDLICHGVPSPKMFKAYMDYLKQTCKYPILDIRFRDKKKNDPRYFISWIKPNGKKKYSLVNLQPYSNGFYKGIFNRESCFTCAFTSPERTGDITLGDYWGIEKSHPELKKKSKNGMSLVICNTLNGRNLFNSVAQELEITISTLEKATERNPRLTHNESRPPLRDITYADLKDKGFDFMAHHYLRPSFYYLHKFVPYWIKKIIKKCNHE